MTGTNAGLDAAHCPASLYQRPQFGTIHGGMNSRDSADLAEAARDTLSVSRSPSRLRRIMRNIGLLGLFCIATALVAHTNFADMNQMINFMKNIAMCGGFLALAASGAGALSVDGRRLVDHQNVESRVAGARDATDR